MGLLEDAGCQNGIEEGVVFSLFLSCDDLSHFAVLVVVVEKCQKGADGRAGEGISRDTREQSASNENSLKTLYHNLIGWTNGRGALSVVLPDVVVDCMFKTIPWTALTSSMWSCWESALS